MGSHGVLETDSSFYEREEPEVERSDPRLLVRGQQEPELTVSRFCPVTLPGVTAQPFSLSKV